MLLFFQGGTTINSELIHDIEVYPDGDYRPYIFTIGSDEERLAKRPKIKVLYQGNGGETCHVIRFANTKEMNHAYNELINIIGYRQLGY